MAQDDTQAPVGKPAATREAPLPTSDGLSVKDAAKRIEDLDLSAILGDDDDEEQDESSAETPRKGKPAPKDEDEEEPETDTDDEDDIDEDEDESDDGENDVDSDEGDEEHDGEVALLPKDAKVRVKVDGVEKVVPLSEALAGYSRQESFTKKSQALAEARRAHEAAVAAKEAEIRAKAEHYASQLGALEMALAQPEPDWDQVRRENPEQFSNIYAAWQIHRDNLAKLAEERQREEHKLQQQYDRERSTIVAAERAKIIAEIPEWGDDSKKGVEFRRALRESSKAFGYSDEELESIADHRAIKVLYKAHMYEKLMAEKQERAAKGKGKVEALQSIKPGAKPAKSSKRRTIVQQNFARLKKSGHVRDAASVIESMIE